ncbi:MAG: hypothetical protein ABFD97_20735 [Syntrophobacter sp.]
MQSGRTREGEVRALYRQMAEKCEEYMALKNLPEGKDDAAEIKLEILRLYAEIVRRCGKAPELKPDLFA